jgi:hypothetical protein
MSRTIIEAIYQPSARIKSGEPVHFIDTKNGIEIPIAGAAEILLHVKNEGPSLATVVIQGGNRDVSPHGNGEDEIVQIPRRETRFIGPIDVAAFAQLGDVVWLDFTPETVGRLSVYRLNQTG